MNTIQIRIIAMEFYGWSPQEGVTPRQWMTDHRDFLQNELDDGSNDPDADLSKHRQDIDNIKVLLS